MVDQPVVGVVVVAAGINPEMLALGDVLGHFPGVAPWEWWRTRASDIGPTLRLPPGAGQIGGLEPGALTFTSVFGSDPYLWHRRARMDRDTHTRRHLLMRELGDLGWDRDLTSLVALALYPIDDHHEPVPGFRKTVDQAIKPLAKRVKRARRGKVPLAEIRVEAHRTLSAYRELARALGDPYYAWRYDAALGLQSR